MGEKTMDALNRRDFLALAALPPLTAIEQPGRPGSMFVCMHEASSERFDFRTAMEGYARAGIKAVEPSLLKVREFAQKESPAVARRLLDDLGLKAVSSSNQVGLPEPGDARARALEDLKWRSSSRRRSAPTASWRRRRARGRTRRTITSAPPTTFAKPARSRSRSASP